MSIRLTKNLKQKIIEQFKKGDSVATIAQWYGKSADQIEGVIRFRLALAELRVAQLEQNDGHRVEFLTERSD